MKHPYEGKKVADFCHVKTVPCHVRQSGSGSALGALVQAAPGSSLALFKQGRGVEAHSLTTDVRAEKRANILPIISSDAISCDEPDLEGETRTFYDQHVAVDAEKALQIALTPQGSAPWRRERAVRITGSICHGLLTYLKRGQNWDAKMENLEKAQAWAGNSATAHGIRAEKHALELYETVCTGKLVTCGLLVQPGCPWLGCSPDGIVMRRGVNF